MFCCVRHDSRLYLILFTVLGCSFLTLDMLITIGLIVFGKWLSYYYRHFPVGVESEKARAARKVTYSLHT